MEYISSEGKVYKDYQSYCNSDDLDVADIFRKLLAGSRTPQNDKEKIWLAEMQKLEAEGKVIDIPSGTF